MRLDAASDSVLVTKNKTGGLVVAAWNLSLPEETGSPKSLTLKFKGMTTGSAKVTIVDKDHGSPLPEFEKLGSPKSPTVEQIAAMRKAAAMPASKTYPLKNGSLSLTLQPKALALIELEK
jgi:xylan 1,4-beta-xylosidase